MKRFWAILLAVMLTAAVVAPASAWELALEGQWLWGYDYIDQGGRAGFFGPFDFANPAIMAPGNAKFNALNAWVGARSINATGGAVTAAVPGQYGLVTGEDAALNWMRTELLPEIRLNKAIRLRGAYQIGSGSFTEYGLYPNSASFGVWNPIASGQWTQFWMTAQTPYGIMIAGKRPFAWGMGAQYDGSSASSESVGFIAPYGPLRIGWVIYPWRQASWINALGSYNIISSIGGTPEANMVPRTWDKQAIRELYPGAFVTYEAGQVSTGMLAAAHWINANPNQSQTVGAAGVQDQTRRTFSAAYEEFSTYFKYNNGRFFLNMEIARFAMNQHTQPSQVDALAGAAFLSHQELPTEPRPSMPLSTAKAGNGQWSSVRCPVLRRRAFSGPGSPVLTAGTGSGSTISHGKTWPTERSSATASSSCPTAC